MTLSTILIVASIAGVLEAEPRLPWGHNVGRIVGGDNTTIEKHPYQVSLEYPDYGGSPFHFCGGAILNAWWVVSAAHCLYGDPDVRVRVGTTTKVNGGYVHEIARVVLHRGYKPPRLDHDICVLKVSRRFRLRNSVRPIALVRKHPPEGSAVVVSGWGRLSLYGKPPTILQEVTLHVSNRRICHERNIILHPVTDGMLCASGDPYHIGSCKGDSGGPLVYGNKLAGIVSWGVGCAHPYFPDVYADVAYYRKWIKKSMKAY